MRTIIFESLEKSRKDEQTTGTESRLNPHQILLATFELHLKNKKKHIHLIFLFKLVFHFQTLLDNFERTVIDDSRLAGRPAEIFVGKLFKMEIWEPMLTSMRVGEVAEFWCDAVVS